MTFFLWKRSVFFDKSKRELAGAAGQAAQSPCGAHVGLRRGFGKGSPAWELGHFLHSTWLAHLGVVARTYTALVPCQGTRMWHLGCCCPKQLPQEVLGLLAPRAEQFPPERSHSDGFRAGEEARCKVLIQMKPGACSAVFPSSPLLSASKTMGLSDWRRF